MTCFPRPPQCRAVRWSTRLESNQPHHSLQLWASPPGSVCVKMVLAEGVEPPAFRFVAECSIQLSYASMVFLGAVYRNRTGVKSLASSGTATVLRPRKWGG